MVTDLRFIFKSWNYLNGSLFRRAGIADFVPTLKLSLGEASA